MTNQRVTCFQFEDIRVEPHNFKAFKAGAELGLEPKTFLLLTYLIEKRDRLIDKRELLDAVWKDVAVTENALTREIGKLRRSLGDDPKAPRYIETVHTRGYRFIPEVRIVDGDIAEEPDEALPISPGLPAAHDSQQTDEIARHLSRWVPYKFFVGISAVVLLGASLSLLLRKPAERERPKPAAVKAGPTTLAILPFQALGTDDRYVGLGIADALITKLSNSAQLVVKPLSTVLHFADPKSDSLAIGRAMQVDYVLEGKYQKLGDRLRVTVQLLCIVCNGTSRWAASFDETSSDLFQVQDSISKKVVASLPLEVSGEEQQRMAKRETNQPEAQLAVFKGKFLQNDDSKEGLDKSTENFEAAVKRDPAYALGWAMLADSYRRREWYGGNPAEFLPIAREAARKASELDDTVPYAHSMRGLISYEYDWDFATAEREYARARQLQNSFVHQWYARMMLATNRQAEAEGEYKRFITASPFSAAGGVHYAEFLYLTGQYQRAIDEIHRDLRNSPNFPPAHDLLGLVYEQQGLSDQAEQEFKKASGLSNGLSGLSALGHLYATKRLLRHTQDVFDDMRAHQRKDYYVSPYQFAVIHAALGYNDRALRELEQAYREHSLEAQWLRCDPRLEALRSDSRYQAFAKRLGIL